MNRPRLFPARRTCEICGDYDPISSRWHPAPRRAFVAALNVVISQKLRNGRERQAAAVRVHVCEKCLVLASQPGPQMRLLGELLVAASVVRYNVMTKGGLI